MSDKAVVWEWQQVLVLTIQGIWLGSDVPGFQDRLLGEVPVRVDDSGITLVDRVAGVRIVLSKG